MMRPDVRMTVNLPSSANRSSISPSETGSFMIVARNERYSPKAGHDHGIGLGSADFVDPVEGVGVTAVLDADQLFAQAYGHRAGLAVRDEPLRGLALDPAHPADH